MGACRSGDAGDAPLSAESIATQRQDVAAALAARDEARALAGLARLQAAGAATAEETRLLAGLLGRAGDQDALVRLLAELDGDQVPVPERLSLALTVAASLPDPAASAEALATRPGEATHQALVAALYVRAGDPRRAIPRWERVAQAWPDQVAVWQALASARSVTGDEAGLLRALERIVALDPRDLAARTSLVLELIERGDREAALRMARPPDQGQPAEAATTAGTILLRARQPEAALAAFDEALGLAPGDCEARWGHAKARWQAEGREAGEAEVWALLRTPPACHVAEATRLLLERGEEATRARLKAALASDALTAPDVVRGVLQTEAR